MKFLPQYVDALRDLEVPPPFAVMISITGAHGARIAVDHRDIATPILQDVLELPEVLIEDYAGAKTYRRTTKPAFDVLWNAGGYASPGISTRQGTGSNKAPSRSHGLYWNDAAI